MVIHLTQSFSPWRCSLGHDALVESGQLVGECHFWFQRAGKGYIWEVLRLERVEGHVARSKADTEALCDEQL